MEVLGGEIGLDLKFESIISPKQYNFTTDRLFCNVLESELLNLYNLVDKKILAETIKEKFTSYDGFISFYDNDINAGSWQFPAKYDHNQWETVIEAYVKEKGVDLLELYYI